MLGVKTIREENGVMGIYWGDEFTPLQDYGTSWGKFFVRGDIWVYAIVGIAEEWHGELKEGYYHGPAIIKNGNIYPTPQAEIGRWAAKAVLASKEEDDNWALEIGELVKTLSGELDCWECPIEPEGRCVCHVSRLDQDDELLPGILVGPVAFELSSPPFPQEIWLYDGSTIREIDEISLDVDFQKTKQLFGELIYIFWFWFA